MLRTVAVEIERGLFASVGELLIGFCYNEVLEDGSTKWMSGKLLLILYAKQITQQTCIKEVEFRSFDESLSYVLEERGEGRCNV